MSTQPPEHTGSPLDSGPLRSRFHALMARIARGDRGALAELVERETPRLRRFLDRKVPLGLLRRVGVSDIIQETAIRLARSELEDRGKVAFRRLLDLTARRLLAQAIEREYAQKRSLARQVEFHETDAATLRDRRLGVEAATPSAVLMQGERLARMKRCFAQLTTEDQRVILLADCQDLPFAEIARLLGTSNAAARKRHSRAAARLRELLGREDRD